MKDLGYIYCITNKVNGKKYIGQTKHHYTKRFKTHFQNLDEDNTVFGKAKKKYGIENFNIKPLEKVPLDKLNHKEIFYIKKHNTFKGNGYNSTAGGFLNFEKKWDKQLKNIFEKNKLKNMNKRLKLIFGTFKCEEDRINEAINDYTSKIFSKMTYTLIEHRGCEECKNTEIRYDSVHDEYYCFNCGLVLKQGI